MDLMSMTDPPIAGDETHTLVGELERQRRIFGWKCEGVSAEGMRARVGVSTMTLGGLVKHLALVEDDHFARLLVGEEVGEPWRGVDFEADPDWEWRTAAEDSPEELMALWRRMVALSRRRVADAAAVDGMATPGVHVARNGEHPLLRRIVVDMISEYARHAGHADLLREAVDGLTGEDAPEDYRA